VKPNKTQAGTIDIGGTGGTHVTARGWLSVTRAMRRDISLREGRERLRSWSCEHEVVSYSIERRSFSSYGTSKLDLGGRLSPSHLMLFPIPKSRWWARHERSERVGGAALKSVGLQIIRWDRLAICRVVAVQPELVARM
jgi:hypothetical protein